jgi:hypothetical protein
VTAQINLNPPVIFHLSPIIRITLLSLYLSLTFPLPFLADITDAPIPPNLLWIALGIGLIILYGALSEEVIVSEEKIEVAYPRWFLLRKGWQLPWAEIQELKLRTTGQGGLVYYFLSSQTDRAYLLPMRMAGFARFINIVTAKTGIDTTDIRPLSQPWMYFLLLALTLFLLLVDLWTIGAAQKIGG